MKANRAISAGLMAALAAVAFVLPARAQEVTRGPYLQRGAPTEITVR